MDPIGIVQNRLSAIDQKMRESVRSVESPQQRFSLILNERLGIANAESNETVTYTYADPANLNPIVNIPLAAVRTTSATTTSAAMEARKAQYQPYVKAAAQKYGLSENLINAVLQTESSFRPDVTSSAGAQGLMQLMPGTARELGVTNSFDPAQNIDGGCKYLRQLLDRFNGDVRLALAAYNAGPARISSLNITTSSDAAQYSKISSGVRGYVDKVLGYAGLA